MKFLRYLLLFIHALVTIATLIALASPIIPPSTFYWPALFALLLPFLLLSQIIFLIYWMVKWEWPALVALFVIVISIPAIDRMIQIGYSSNVQDKEAFQLLSYNIHGLGGPIKSGSEKMRAMQEEWNQYSRSMDEFDILALQECTQNAQKFIESTEKYKYEIFCDSRPSIRLYSRFKIIDNGCIHLLEDHYNQAMWADILIPGKDKSVESDTIRVYNIHLASNRISSISERMVREKNMDPENLYKDTRSMFALYKNQAPQRVKEINKILEHSLQTSHPTIICGDFNETPQSHVYRLATDRFDDAFVAEGSGMCTTYAGYLPFLRIDYILYSDRLKPVSFRRGSDIKFSDHYPIAASLKLSE